MAKRRRDYHFSPFPEQWNIDVCSNILTWQLSILLACSFHLNESLSISYCSLKTKDKVREARTWHWGMQKHLPVKHLRLSKLKHVTNATEALRFYWIIFHFVSDKALQMITLYQFGCKWPHLYWRRTIRLGRAWVKNGKSSGNPSMYKYRQADGSTFLTSYPGWFVS